VLLQDPLHPPGTWTFTNHRDFEEGNTIGADLGKVYDFILKFGIDQQFRGGGSYELRLSRAMPTICYFRIDDCIYWAPYLAQTYGDRSPHMKVDRGGELFEVLERHFDRLWEAEVNRAIPLPDGVWDELLSRKLIDQQTHDQGLGKVPIPAGGLGNVVEQWKSEVKDYENRYGRPMQGYANG
jgi:hypothetical protein